MARSKGIKKTERSTSSSKSSNQFDIDQNALGQVLAISSPINPWNKLGVCFEDENLRKDMRAVLRTICNWEPQPKLLYLQLEDGNFYPISDYQGIIRSDVELWYNPETKRKEVECLQVASSTYEIVPNEDCFLWCQPLIDEGLLELEAACVMDGGRRIVIACKTANNKARLGDRGDDIEMRLILGTSHDSTIPIMIGKSLSRVQCWNFIATWLGDKTKDYIGFRHTLGVQDRLKKARTYVADVIREFRKETVPVYRDLREVKLDMDGFREYCSVVFEDALKANGKVRAIEDYQPYSRLQAIYTSSHLMSHVPDSYYRGVQAVTEYLSQYSGGTDTVSQYASRFKGNLFGQNKATAKRALEVAVSLSGIRD